MELVINGKVVNVDQKVHLTYNDIQIKPGYSPLRSRSECITTSRISQNYTLDIPMIASPMDTVCEHHMAFELWKHGGLGLIHRFGSIDWQVDQVNLTKEMILENAINDGTSNTFILGAAIGATGDYMERAEALIDAGVNVILIDIAHGHSIIMKDALQALTSYFSQSRVDFIAGSIATGEAAQDLIEWGANGLRCGVGNGSMCTTRIRTGAGVPQVSALIDVIQVADQYDIPVIADGGIRQIGDIAKALALGSDTVMIGSLFAGTKESPGSIRREGHWPNERLYKTYRGSASLDSKLKRGEAAKNVEGNSTRILYRGKAKRLISDMLYGIRSSMSYVGARDLDEFRAKAQLVRVSQSGIVEASPHGFIDHSV